MTDDLLFEKWLDRFGDPDEPYEHALADFRDWQRRLTAKALAQAVEPRR